MDPSVDCGLSTEKAQVWETKYVIDRVPDQKTIIIISFADCHQLVSTLTKFL